MKYDFSVIVATYHPDKAKILATLNSIVMQKNVRFEVIIADDGSPDFFEPEICAFMEQHAFSDYRIIAHEKNQGTVLNLYDAVAAASGMYIKGISPGDYLYDENTLSALYQFMEQHGAKAAFGDMVFYSDNDGLKVLPMLHPVDNEIYLPDSPHYTCERIKKHLLVFGDLICGASMVFQREAFMEGLETIRNTVIYAEDTVIQLMALQKLRLYRIPRYIVWYEHGSGISTNSERGFAKRIQDDFFLFYEMLRRTYGDEPTVRRAFRKWSILTSGSRMANLLYRLACVDQTWFSLRSRKKLRAYHPADHDPGCFNKIISF